MALYKPTELKAFLESLGIEPKKALSQNFLIDGNIIRNIVKAADVQPGDQILEIGPGPGSLTEELLRVGAQVVAVETDRTLAHALERLQTDKKTLKVVVGDALKVPTEELFSHFSDKQKRIKLIGNLPYHITTPLLTRFIPLTENIESIVVMVQDEVGRRMTAQPKSSTYGSITVFLSFYANVSYAFRVGRNCFYPAPNVDSAVIRFDLKPTPPEVDPVLFFQLTRRSFEQRRKALRNSLKELYEPSLIVQVLEEMHLSSLTRPEELSLEEFLSLYRRLAK